MFQTILLGILAEAKKYGPELVALVVKLIPLLIQPQAKITGGIHTAESVLETIDDLLLTLARWVQLKVSMGF